MTQWRYLPIVVATACLTACSGKGVDASLNLSSQEQYNQSYLVAAKDMTDEQKKAYEWAVSTLSLPQAAAKWKSPTPRQIITDESNAYIKAHTDLIAKETQKMAQRKDELEANEALITEISQELRKITASRPIEHQFEKVAGDVFSRQPVVTVKNESRFNISSANWDVTLLLDGEAASKRTCFDNTTFKSGLDSHSSKPDTVFYADRCSDWNTVEVRRGKTFRFEYALDIRSVEDFSGKRILPVDLPTKAIFEAKIADAKSEIDLANKMKATVQ